MSTEEQTVRARLRLDFLNVMKRLNGRELKLTTCEGNELSCNLVGFDRDGEKLAVTDLITPTGEIKQAILRTSDIDLVKILK